MQPAEKPPKLPPKWLIPWMGRAHVKIYQLSQGRIGGHTGGNDVVLLRTIGRRTGNPHTVALTFVPHGDDMLIIGSYGGAETHPAWYHNLRSNPEVVVQQGRRAFWANSATVVGDERDELWALVVADSPQYEHYQAQTEREIPVVRLTYSRPFTG